MLVVGLTGNIGSGKSSVARFLKDMGAKVIDTDQVARNVVAPGTPGLQQITLHFGTGVLNADGTLDRPQMAQIVFNNRQALELLNSIVHPAIRAEVLEAITDYKNIPDAPLLVIEAPLLIETGMYKLVDQVWLVIVDAQTQIQRVIERDAATAEQVAGRLAAQMPQTDKLPYAQKVIDNSGTPESTLQQVQQIWSDAIDRPQAQAE
ncbi:dephospho-CoA kinase [Desulfoscipio sp. XC116]|uniref:dephospho-CoA kinase n=1 Tax=Desulfoscipio sp. XC116 TaxID=3144975 RepID=UPI00325AF8E6